ncbi:MAG: hypothetical protein IJ165_06130, partial [Proteobacteria bacterium]|nr:hypothetical protein [Pseudomonadota bacterium]
MFKRYDLCERYSIHPAPVTAHTFTAPTGRLILTGGKRSVTPGGHTSSPIRRIRDDEDAEENKKKPATFYSPTQSPMQYHRRK